MHILTDILRNSILITGLVVMMMMMIESFNIESHGKFFMRLRGNRLGRVLTGALLGSIPGCMGGFATVSLYTHRMLSLGALVAMMIASSGDEAFVMIAMIPDKVWWIVALLFAIAVVSGLLVDFIHDKWHSRRCGRQEHADCGDTMNCDMGYLVHDADSAHSCQTDHSCHSDSSCHPEPSPCHPELHPSHPELGSGTPSRHFGRKRILLLLGTALFIASLAGGILSHEHAHVTEHHHEECSCHSDHSCHPDTPCHSDPALSHPEPHPSHPELGSGSVNLLSEDWMNVLFAALSLIMLMVIFRGSDHFVEHHLWDHIIVKHLPSIFAWTFGVLALMAVLLQHMDISAWISDNTALMILLAVLIGIIPESGPHMIFVTLYVGGIVPLPVLLASCISQDGHASIPLLAESKISFLKAKLINSLIALIVGYVSMFIS